VPHTTPYSIDNRVLSRGGRKERKRLGIEVPRFRMSGGIPLLPAYAFMAWTGKTMLFTAILMTASNSVHLASNGMIFHE